MQNDDKQSILDKFGQDITKLAKDGKLDPVIGRDDEIRRTIQILSRRTKNNPVLIGEPGVGKTAIIESLAQKIVKNDIPSSLKNKRIISLEMSSLIAGAAYKGQFEDRLKKLLKEIEDSSGEILLFIDEIHTIVGAGKSEGSMDAGNMLKPALARGTLHLIGATTLSEYRQYIEKDSALERRFQPVYVNEPNFDNTLAILRGLKEKYEVHHGVKISDDALISATELSMRYLPDRFLPDKAIDLLDEATSALKIQLESMPISLDKLNNKKLQLEIEDAALKKDKSDKAKARKREIEEHIDTLKNKIQTIEAKWNKEKELLEQLSSHSEKLESLRSELEIAERDADLTTASRIKYGEIPEITKKLEATREELAKIPNSERLLREEVTADDIASVVTRWTGIPVDKLLESESEKLANLEEEIEKRVVGQDDAVESIANAIRRSRVGLSPENQPIGSFLFLGPTGVGKTEVAKTLSEQLFNSEDTMIRIDMSEYMEKHSVSRLIGSPPGYIGHEDGGQLTEAVRRRPYSVILFDEIEKAHPDVFNIFLQILDDGRLTDNKGRVVNFSNTVIIMTSNIASQKILENSDNLDKIRPEIQDILLRSFKPEFINRIDEIVLFNQLNQTEIDKIIALQLNSLAKMLQKSKDIKLTFDESVYTYLKENGYSPAFGARPLKRLIKSDILNTLSKELIKNTIVSGDTVKGINENGKIFFQKID